MLALKLLKTFKSSPRAEDSLEMKCLEHSEGLKFVGKCLIEVHRGTEEAGVLKGDM